MRWWGMTAGLGAGNRIGGLALAAIAVMGGATLTLVLPLGPVQSRGPEPAATQTADAGAEPLSVGLEFRLHGELTAADGGRDWYEFDALAERQYIVELAPRTVLAEADDQGLGGVEYFPGHLSDPAILEIVDSGGARVLGERDGGGFCCSAARAYFTPDTDGSYRIAAGAGSSDRDQLGHYTISVREDDHADDFNTDAEIALRPGGSITARIDSDVAPSDPGFDPMGWWRYPDYGEGVMRPRRGVESPDDRDVIRLQIESDGWYELVVWESPPGVGFWYIWDDQGNLDSVARYAPVVAMADYMHAGTYYVEFGTPYQSVGSVGPYTVSLNPARLSD